MPKKKDKKVIITEDKKYIIFTEELTEEERTQKTAERAQWEAEQESKSEAEKLAMLERHKDFQNQIIDGNLIIVIAKGRIVPDNNIPDNIKKYQRPTKKNIAKALQRFKLEYSKKLSPYLQGVCDYIGEPTLEQQIEDEDKLHKSVMLGSYVFSEYSTFNKETGSFEVVFGYLEYADLIPPAFIEASLKFAKEQFKSLSRFFKIWYTHIEWEIKPEYK